MFCTKCGKQIPDNAAFCGYCGARTGVEKAPRVEEIKESKESKETNEVKAIKEEPAKTRKVPRVPLLIALAAVVALGAFLLFGLRGREKNPEKIQTAALRTFTSVDADYTAVANRLLEEFGAEGSADEAVFAWYDLTGDKNYELVVINGNRVYLVTKENGTTETRFADLSGGAQGPFEFAGARDGALIFRNAEESPRKLEIKIFRDGNDFNFEMTER